MNLKFEGNQLTYFLKLNQQYIYFFTVYDPSEIVLIWLIKADLLLKKHLVLSSVLKKVFAEIIFEETDTI